MNYLSLQAESLGFETIILLQTFVCDLYLPLIITLFTYIIYPMQSLHTMNAV